MRLLTVLFATLGLLVTACMSSDGEDTAGAVIPAISEAPATEGESTTTSTSSGSTTVETPEVRPNADLVIWADQANTAVIRSAADDFASGNGITAAVQQVNLGDIRRRLLIAGPAGEGPDVIIGAHDWVGQLVTSGLLDPVDMPNTQDFSDVAIQAMSYDGQLYGVAFAIETIALIRNVDLVPEAPATFDELESVALDLVAKGAVDIPLAIQNDPGDPYHFFPLYTAAGGYLFGQNPDGSLDPYDLGLDNADGLAAGRQIQAWAESGLLTPNLTYNMMIESFGRGRAPFAITGPWAVGDPDRGFETTGVNYLVEPIPPLDGITASPFVTVQGLMVSANSENPVLAQTFITEVMTTEEVQIELFEASGRPPAHLAAFEAAAADDPDTEGFGRSGLNGEPQPSIPEMGSVWSAWADAYAEILSGESPGDEAFADAASQIRRLLTEGG